MGWLIGGATREVKRMPSINVSRRSKRTRRRHDRQDRLLLLMLDRLAFFFSLSFLLLLLLAHFIFILFSLSLKSSRLLLFPIVFDCVGLLWWWLRLSLLRLAPVSGVFVFGRVVGLFPLITSANFWWFDPISWIAALAHGHQHRAGVGGGEYSSMNMMALNV